MADPPDVQRGREHRARGRRRAGGARRRRARGLPHPGRRRQLAGRDRRDRRPPRRGAPRRGRGAAPRGAHRPRAGVPRGVRAGRSTAARATCARWTQTSRTTPRTSRACSPRRAPAPASRSARATSPGGGIADWGALRRAVSRGGSWYARRVLGVDVRDLTGGFKCFRAEVLRGDRPADRALARLRLPGRAHLPHRLRRLRRRRGADRVPRPAPRRVEDVVADRARGGVARARDPRARPRRRPPGGRRGSSPGRRAPKRCVMDHRDLALVQGLDHTRATLRRWNAAPGRVVGLWALGAFAIACALLYLVWAVSHRVTPDTRAAAPARRQRAGDRRGGGAGARPQLARARPPRLRVRRRLHRRQPASRRARPPSRAVAPHPRGRRPARHRVRRRRRRCSRSATQAFVLGSDAATLSAQLQSARRCSIVTLLPHALPELTALFLPLAAWLVASRRRQFDELLAATVATTALAAPVLVLAAAVEVWVWPHLLRAALSARLKRPCNARRNPWYYTLYSAG